MALFGLSPLFLAAIATNFFTDPVTEQLNIYHFMTFLTLLTGLVYILGFINLQGVKQAQITLNVVEENISEETAPLLAPTPRTMQTSDPSPTELLCQMDFWLLIVFCVLIIGAVRIFSPILVFCS